MIKFFCSFDDFVEEDDDSPNDVVNFAHADGEDDDNPMEGPISIILGDFKTYVQNARNQCVPFRPWLRGTLELLYILRKSNASLVLYDRVMAWHQRQLSTSHLCHDSILKREKVFISLFKRYNMLDNLNIIRKITLPSSHAHAKIITNSFQWCLQSLLTDPRIVADDYLFFDDNPFAPPPHDLDYIGDINTSKASDNRGAGDVESIVSMVNVEQALYVLLSPTALFKL